MSRDAADGRLRVSVEEATSPVEGRFDRLQRIGWWDQSRLARARVLVVGAGALGNEIVKNLALLGVGSLFLVDLDRIEHSNLSRSVLYRERDEGRFKAETAAAAARDLYPAVRVQPFSGSVFDLGLGVFRWADVVIAGLDNREARLAVNRACLRVGRPWIDGAIEQIQGCARVFAPDGPCYECTMSEIDWRILRQRRSCNLLTRAEMEGGRTPTTPTVASIVAGVQCQEAVKLLHGLPTLAGRGWTFEGLTGESFQVEYQRKEECYSHEPFDDIASLGRGAGDASLRALLDEGRRRVGDDAVLELGRDLAESSVCPRCGEVERLFRPLHAVAAGSARCERCGGPRELKTFHSIRGDEDFLDRTWSDLGCPPFDVVAVRGGERTVGLELSGDADAVLGPTRAREVAP